ncbi:MAG: bifunctional phosphoribosylaminoimidazolecarboxamide formyltransferase/IMP cyclohydrolase [Phycisphaerales bacterium]|jgi:phosphoribosylaminoimidazolecarboxamide formyltransferase/IMP cyclohydrolase|nr:bifunctional phosphoribosylaminoimidazolecarboxamide formyltransferase/IMP cyclohydrolase [Phycisphaerales bacterium]MDP7087113.1 bifunctional phosphoribosylaminoimidazolecarboxamide formyltransferase/IMP cyclohydrolase [Phycisphaerales bacterium]
MPDLVQVKRALISVSDKSDVVAFARSLSNMGVEVISTGGTAAALQAAGVATTPVEDVTGFPEMMDGRVKTLHPRIHGGLLGRRDVASHVEAMETHEIQPIDLVCINLYPFERTVESNSATEQETIEQIDIGGPAMLRSASKNHDFVATLTSPSQYDTVIAEMQATAGSTSLHLRRQLAAAAFARTAGYDAAISNWLSQSTNDALPPRLQLTATRVTPLRYGENPHQAAALYALPGTGEAGIANASTIDGKPLSFNNINDAAGAFKCCRDLQRSFDERVAAIVVKHASPCGAAIGNTPAEAFEGAWAGDPLAAFGGIVAMSCPIDAALAQTITAGKRFLEVIVATEFHPEAIRLLIERWKNIRLVTTPEIGSAGSASIDVRTIPGGLLVQTPDLKIARPSQWTHAAGPPPTPDALVDATVAWVAVKHAASNAITVAGGGRLFGLGGGQVDRLSAARIAVAKAEAAIAEHGAATAASDAFFPFPDGPKTLIDAGITCIVQPGGSKRDEETMQLCNERGVTCMTTGVRHFRH